MNFEFVSVDSVDNSVENSNFSRFPPCFNHKFFFNKHGACAYKRDIILLIHTFLEEYGFSLI